MALTQMHENLSINPSQNASDSECFDAANQQLWVYLMGVYYTIIIIKILKKRILISRIIHFRRFQILL